MKTVPCSPRSRNRNIQPVQRGVSASREGHCCLPGRGRSSRFPLARIQTANTLRWSALPARRPSLVKMHVALDRLRSHEQLCRYRLVGTSLRHERQHLDSAPYRPRSFLAGPLWAALDRHTRACARRLWHGRSRPVVCPNNIEVHSIDSPISRATIERRRLLS